MFPRAGQGALPRPALFGLAIGVVLALASFALYVSRTLSHPHVLDSAELAAAAFGLGVAHPPGQPLALLFGKAFSSLPLGSVAFRVGLFQAACGTWAVVLVYLLVLQSVSGLLPRLRPRPVPGALIAAAAAATFALSPGAIDVSTRPEVYALATALALGALWLAQNAWLTGDVRWAVGAAFVLGLAMGNHPLIAGTAGLGAVAACVPLLGPSRKASRARLILGAVAAFGAGCLVLLYVPARAHALLGAPDGDTLVWGDARSSKGWWWVLSARTFAEKNALVQSSADPGSLPFLFVEELKLAALVLALVGLYALLRSSPRGRWWAAALLLCGGGAASAGLLGGLDPHNPDVRGYLGAAFATAAVLAGCGASAVAALVAGPLRQRALALALGLSLLAWPGLSLARASRLPVGVSLPERVVRQGLIALPPQTTLLTGHFETGFLTAYLRLVEGLRPDVTWAHMGFARGPGYAERLQKLAPHLAPLLAAHAHGPVTAAAVDRLPTPLALEALVPVDARLARGMNYSGGLWHWPAVPVSGDATGLGGSGDQIARSRREICGFVAWRLFQDAQLACGAGHPIAPALVTRLQALVPGDRLGKALAGRCSGNAPPPTDPGAR